MTQKFFLALAMFGLSALPVQAEIVYFNDGRNLSIQSHHADGDRMVMAMRGGGEMTLEASLISHIEPDEVPHPDPEPAAAPAPPPAALANVRKAHPRIDP